MELSSINHLNLTVQDLPRAEKFYTEVLGMEVAWRGTGMVFLRCGPVDVALQRGDAVVVSGFHFGCRASSRQEVLDWKSHFEDHQVPLVEFLDGPEESSLKVADPDGYCLEIYYE